MVRTEGTTELNLQKEQQQSAYLRIWVQSKLQSC